MHEGYDERGEDHGQDQPHHYVIIDSLLVDDLSHDQLHDKLEHWKYEAPPKVEVVNSEIQGKFEWNSPDLQIPILTVGQEAQNKVLHQLYVEIGLADGGKLERDHKEQALDDHVDIEDTVYKWIDRLCNFFVKLDRRII